MAITVLFMGTTVASAQDVTKDSMGSITITGGESGLEVKAYRVVETLWDNEGPIGSGYRWSDWMYDWVCENESVHVNNLKDGDSYQAGDLKQDDPTWGSIYNNLAKDIRRGKAVLWGCGWGEVDFTPAPTQTVKMTGDSVTLDNLPMGNYLIMVSGGSGKYVYKASTANLVPAYEGGAWTLENATTKLKREELDARMSHADGKRTGQASLGDKISHKVETLIPQLSDYDAATVTRGIAIGESPSAGLTVDTASIAVFALDGEEEATELASNTDYTLQAPSQDEAAIAAPDGSTERNLGFLVTMTESFMKSVAENSYAKVLVTYNVSLNKSATTGTPENTDTSFVWWSNPYGQWYVRSGETVDYTYGICLLNGKKGESTYQSDSSFTVKRDGVKDNLKFVRLEDGKYRLALDSDGTVVTEVSVDEQGKLFISGLGASVESPYFSGEYTLTETKAKSGYHAAVTGSALYAQTDWNATYELTGALRDSSKDYPAHQIVYVNRVGLGELPALPSTGGMGTALIIAAGVVLVGAAIAIMRSGHEADVRR